MFQIVHFRYYTVTHAEINFCVLTPNSTTTASLVTPCTGVTSEGGEYLSENQCSQKSYPIYPIYFGRLNVEREKFWPQIIVPTNFNVSRCTDEISGSFLHLQSTTFTLLRNQNTACSFSVESIHLPHQCFGNNQLMIYRVIT